MLWVWVQFFICLVLIVLAGTRLAKYGDLIAEKTGLGRVWIGVVLLATVTSLPELATGISSVTLVDSPNLTMGNLFGANLINLMIIAIIDLVRTGGPVLHYLGTGIVLSTILSLFMITAAAAFLFLAQNLLTISLFGQIGIYSLALFVLYLIGQYMLFKYQSSEAKESQGDKAPLTAPSPISLGRVILFFSTAALVTVGAGTWLAFIGDQIAEGTGLGASFVGAVFLSICTSSPEITVSVSAARLGALEMAVGNVVGSNMFNMGVIIFVNDLFYKGRPILQGVDTNHMITALFAVLMSSIVIVGVIYRPRLWLRIWVGLDTAAIAILYFGALITLYLLTRGA